MAERRKGVKNVGKKIDRYIPQPVILSEEDRLDAMSGSAGEAW